MDYKPNQSQIRTRFVTTNSSWSITELESEVEKKIGGSTLSLSSQNFQNYKLRSALSLSFIFKILSPDSWPTGKRIFKTVKKKIRSVHLSDAAVPPPVGREPPRRIRATRRKGWIFIPVLTFPEKWEREHRFFEIEWKKESVKLFFSLTVGIYMTF